MAVILALLRGSSSTAVTAEPETPRVSGAATGTADPRSIVVLPLERIGTDEGADDFVDGFADDLTLQLSTIGSLRVISPTSARRFKDFWGD